MAVLGGIRMKKPYFENVPNSLSYYEATANRSSKRKSLQASQEADVCIVGAGYTGISAALFLAEKGYKPIILEAVSVGWGASGRNGGHLVNFIGSHQKAMQFFGHKRADYIGRFAKKGVSIVRQLIKKYKINCGLVSKNICVAYDVKQMEELKQEYQLMQKYDIESQLLDREELKEHLGTNLYCGGLLDVNAGHLHPLNLVLGEAAALEKLGGVIYENSPVVSINTKDNMPLVKTNKGEIRCKKLLLCGNGYLNIVPKLGYRILSLPTHMVATEPLGKKLAKQILPSNACVSDERYILDYYRLSQDYRLLFGGGVTYGVKTPKDIEAKLRPNIENIFSQLKGVKIDYTWSGNIGISFSRFPQIGKVDENTYFAQGYSGDGIGASHVFGEILSEAVTGYTKNFLFFSKLPWLPFPGGRKLRAVYSILCSWWYTLRDFIRI